MPTDSTGHISLDNLRKACQEAGIKFTQKELEEMVEEADVNGDGQIDQSEFIRIMLQTNLFWLAGICQSVHVDYNHTAHSLFCNIVKKQGVSEFKRKKTGNLMSSADRECWILKQKAYLTLANDVHFCVRIYLLIVSVHCSGSHCGTYIAQHL